MEGLQEAAAALAPLGGSLVDRDSRAAACKAWAGLARLDTSLRATAELLGSLEAWSPSQASMTALADTCQGPASWWLEKVPEHLTSSTHLSGRMSKEGLSSTM